MKKQVSVAPHVASRGFTFLLYVVESCYGCSTSFKLFCTLFCWLLQFFAVVAGLDRLVLGYLRLI